MSAGVSKLTTDFIFPALKKQSFFDFFSSFHVNPLCHGSLYVDNQTYSLFFFLHDNIPFPISGQMITLDCAVLIFGKILLRFVQDINFPLVGRDMQRAHNISFLSYCHGGHYFWALSVSGIFFRRTIRSHPSHQTFSVCRIR